jgi:hypothetical protein
MKLIRQTSRDVFGYAAREKPKQFAESRKGHAQREFGSAAASPIDVPLNSSSGLPFRNPRSAIRIFFLHHLELFAPLLLMTAERVCTPANSFHDAFELLQLVCGKLREDFFHCCRMLSKNRDNEFLAARGKCDDSNATILRAFDPAYQSLAIQTVNRDADRPWGQIHLWSDRIYRQRTLVQEHLKNPEV